MFNSVLVSSRKFTGAEKQSVMIFLRKGNNSVLLIEVKQVSDQEKYSVEALFLIPNLFRVFYGFSGCWVVFVCFFLRGFLMHYCQANSLSRGPWQTLPYLASASHKLLNRAEERKRGMMLRSCKTVTELQI